MDGSGEAKEAYKGQACKGIDDGLDKGKEEAYRDIHKGSGLDIAVLGIVQNIDDIFVHVELFHPHHYLLE